MRLEPIGRVAECDLFQGVTAEDLEEMMGCLQPTLRRYAKGAVIAAAGDPFFGLGIVASGRAAVTRESAAGDRVILALLEPGMMFGEMAAFSSMRVWPATVVAHEACEVVFISPDRIVGQCANQCPHHRQLIRNMLAIVSNRALMLNRKVAYLSRRSVRGKISAYLLEQYEQSGKRSFTLPLGRNDMADYLNVARPALSREMGRMRDEGIIRFHRSAVEIRDVESLRQWALG